MKNYKIVNGYMINDVNDKEELLDLLINIMSSAAQVVNYSQLKALTAQQLLDKIENFQKNYNAIVYEFDLEHNCRIFKANFAENRTLEYNGKKIIIENRDSFVKNCAERAAEGNELTNIEKLILNELEN